MRSVQDLLRLYADHGRVSRGTPRRAAFEASIERMDRLLGNFFEHRDRPVSAMGEDGFVSRYLTWRAGVSETTAIRELRVVQAALRWGAKAGLVPPMVLGLPSVPLKVRDRFLTRDEVQGLLAAPKPAHLDLFIRLALNTAGRAGALMELTWSRVDIPGRLVHLEDPSIRGKHKGRATVKISQEFSAFLSSVPHEGERVISGRNIRGISYDLGKLASSLGMVGVSPHVLRHTAATFMARSGVGIWEISKFLGHSSVLTTERIYAHHTPEFFERAVAAIGDLAR